MAAHHRAQVVRPGEGRTFSFGGRQLRVLADTDSGDGGVAAFESSPAPGGAVPPPHRHHAHEEAFYLLEGAMDFFIDGEHTRVEAGSLVHVPTGVAHTFANPGPAPARMLVLIAPADGLALVEAHGALLSSGGPPNPTALQELYARYQSEIVAP